MNGWTIAAIVVGVMLVCSLAFIVVVAVAGLRAARGVEMQRNIGDDSYAIRTPAGRASARLVVHPDHGKVFEVSTYWRNEAPGVGYVPPTEHLLRNFVEYEVADYAIRQTARGRRVARSR